jgi:hypothetical protein
VKRRIFNAIAVVSLVAIVFLFVLRMTAQLPFEEYVVGFVFNAHSKIYAVIRPSEVMFGWNDRNSVASHGLYVRDEDLLFIEDWKLCDGPGFANTLGFGTRRGTYELQSSKYDPPLKVRCWDLYLPNWFLILDCAILPALWIRLRLRKNWRVKRRLCCECGYDLRFTPYRCPECGTVPEKARMGSSG